MYTSQLSSWGSGIIAIQRDNGYKSQRQWLSTREQCSLDAQGSCIYELPATVAYAQYLQKLKQEKKNPSIVIEVKMMPHSHSWGAMGIDCYWKNILFQLVFFKGFMHDKPNMQPLDGHMPKSL